MTENRKPAEIPDPSLTLGKDLGGIALHEDEATQPWQQYYDDHVKELEDMVANKTALYAINRNLEGEHSYVTFLPPTPTDPSEGGERSKPKTFIEVIDERIAERKIESESSGQPYEPVTVLDLGPGNFQALLDAREKWGSDVTLVGVGPDVLMDFDGAYRKHHGGGEVHPTRKKVEEAGIQVMADSLVNLGHALPAEIEPDVILSCHALQYTNTPLWETFSGQIYERLKPGGYAFLAFGPPHISTGYSVFAEEPEHFAYTDVVNAMNERYKNDLGHLDKYLRGKGYSFRVSEEGTLSCQKILVDESYELPADVHTIIRPTAKGLGLQDKNNPWIKHWLKRIPQGEPSGNTRYLSAYPIMDIPA